MRKDMNKVVTERPRFGGKGKIKNKFDRVTKPKEKRTINNVPVDLSLKHESMRKRYVVGGDYKTPSDLLSPLQRFLISKVGEPWNEVWSEICKVFKADGWQANHIKDHIKYFVGGTTHSGQKDSMTLSYTNFPRELDHNLIYVDENGILQKGKLYGRRWWQKKPKKVYNHVSESDTVEYHRINGCWYRITGEKYMKTYINIVAGKTVEMKEEVFTTTKRALNKREAKKLDLVNRLSTKKSKLFPEK